MSLYSHLKTTEKIFMFIGKHFGKRKPQWNFFITNYENFKYSESSKLFKLILFGFIFQIVLFSPIVYWIFQNYAIIESFLPQHGGGILGRGPRRRADAHRSRR